MHIHILLACLLACHTLSSRGGRREIEIILRKRVGRELFVTGATLKYLTEYHGVSSNFRIHWATGKRNLGEIRVALAMRRGMCLGFR